MRRLGWNQPKYYPQWRFRHRWRLIRHGIRARWYGGRYWSIGRHLETRIGADFEVEWDKQDVGDGVDAADCDAGNN